MTSGDGAEPDLRILQEERLRTELEHRSRTSRFIHHRGLVITWLAALVIIGLVPYLGYVALQGDPSLQAWATHLLAVIVGAAAGSLWRSALD
jgi:hypothetical protein